MSIADKLTTIANNVPLVYEAGNAAGGGGSPVEEKDVNFYDYDGTLLYSYTLEEAQALTELPPIPDYHEHLIPYEWNWSLDDVQTIEDPADVGAIYGTEDQATFLFLDIIELRNATVALNFGGTPNIDWGDGAISNSASTGIEHTYGTTGKYTIKITGSHTVGGGTTSAPIVSTGKKNVVSAFVDRQRSCAAYAFYGLNSLETAACVAVSTGLFEGCFRLKYATIRRAVYFAARHFFNCYALSTIALPKSQVGVQSQSIRNCYTLRRLRNKYTNTAEGYNMQNCYALDEVHMRNNSGAGYAQNTYSARRATVHEGVTTIGATALYGCHAEIIEIASTVTTIGAQALQNISGAKRIIFLSETPPTVANANAFSGILAGCIVEVPAASLTAYQEATNYSGIAAQMVGV